MGSKLTRSIRGLSTVALLLGGITGLAACANNGSTRSTTFAEPPTYSGWTDEGYTPPTRAAAPAPTPAPARVEPARVVSGPCPPYAPAASADMYVSSLALPTGEVATSAVLVHHVIPKQVRAKTDFGYQIHVTNLTRATHKNVIVQQVDRDNLNIVRATPAGQRNAEGNMEWNLGDLQPCETKVLNLTAQAERVGQAFDCFFVDFDNHLCASTTVVEPALALKKTMTPEVLICDNINMTFEVKNTGTGIAEGVVIRDELPNGLSTLDGRNVIELNAGNLAAGETKVLNAVVKAARTGRFENNAVARSSSGLSADSGRVASVVRQPVLELTSNCEEQEYIGRNADYRFCVKNTGDAPAANTVLVATLPAGATLRSASDGGAQSGNSVTWNLGTLPPGQERCVTLVLLPTSQASFRVESRVSATCANQVTKACETRIVGIPAVLLEVIDLTDPVEIGDNTTYVITVTNQGSARDTDIQIVATLAPEQEYVSSSGATQSNVNGRTITFSPVPVLEAKQRAEWRIVVKAARPGDVRFAVTLDTEQLTRNVQETESTNQYE